MQFIFNTPIIWNLSPRTKMKKHRSIDSTAWPKIPNSSNAIYIPYPIIRNLSQTLSAYSEETKKRRIEKSQRIENNSKFSKRDLHSTPNNLKLLEETSIHPRALARNSIIARKTKRYPPRDTFHSRWLMNTTSLQGSRFTKAETGVDTVNGARRRLMDKQWRSGRRRRGSVSRMNRVPGHARNPR